ncbi:hypothetical protein SNE40_001314 [Patella caerulea]|uniref:Reverse transcriptase domain-containing protein n=1 Tax=Patella caerulea TaxID=87958 RepID=A0AAN8QHX4_PATCE
MAILVYIERKHYSTKTLTLKLCNDVLWGMEHQQLTAFIAVDLSAAFDTVHHQLLLDVLETSFGVRSKAKRWIASYLTDRNFEVHVHDSCSDASNINLSVPQGSINGPVLFTCFDSTLQYSICDGINLIG